MSTCQSGIDPPKSLQTSLLRHFWNGIAKISFKRIKCLNFYHYSFISCDFFRAGKCTLRFWHREYTSEILICLSLPWSDAWENHNIVMCLLYKTADGLCATIYQLYTNNCWGWQLWYSHLAALVGPSQLQQNVLENICYIWAVRRIFVHWLPYLAFWALSSVHS